jgi:hypothetical protein
VKALKAANKEKALIEFLRKDYFCSSKKIILRRQLSTPLK